MNEWKDYVNEVREKGFENASPLARLVWSCEVGHIDQHASTDLIKIIDRIAELETAASDLFQACSELPLPEMNRMEKEINAVSAALKQ